MLGAFVLRLLVRRAVPVVGFLAAATSVVTCAGQGADNAAKSSGSTGGSVRALETTLATGAMIRLKALTPLSTRENHAGDAIRASAVAASLSEHGDTVIPADAEFVGTVTAAEPGKPNHQGTLQISFTQVRWGGHSYPVATRVTSIAEQQSGRGITGGTAAKVGAGAIAGGIAGRIIGGNRTGTIVGGLAGAAAGGAVAHETRDIDIIVPAGSTIRVVLTRPFAAQVASNQAR